MARLLSETDVKLHKVEDERNDLWAKLKDRDRELFISNTANTSLRRENEACLEAKQRVEDEGGAG